MLNLRQQLRLQPKLSPQQIQFIKLLQLPSLALEQRIQSELESNPLLEEGTYAEDDLASGEEAEEEAAANEDNYDWEELLAAGDDLYGYKARVDRARDELPEVPMPVRASLSDHLHEQLAFLNLDPLETLIADQIIGSIDEDGYLRRPEASIVDDIAFNHARTLSERDVVRVLRHIQRLEPVGIATRNLRECLLVQLEALPEDTPGRPVAVSVLRSHFEAFSKKHFSRIKKKLHIDDETLKEGFDLILRLDPKPGGGAFSAEQHYITPDFTVRNDGEEFVIVVNGRNAPELRISAPYRTMLRELAGGRRRKPEDEEIRKFLRKRIESAQWFITSIRQRQQTMVKVMEAIVQLQTDFFRFGEGHLRPMILKDVAERISMDISTVSRVVNGKYVQCDFGVYELKHFFSEGLPTDTGGSVSNREVKAIIQRMVDGEDKTRPLSDQSVASLLAERGFRIARRTVTKYRVQLNIPVARLRRQIVLK